MASLYNLLKLVKVVKLLDNKEETKDNEIDSDNITNLLLKHMKLMYKLKEETGLEFMTEFAITQKELREHNISGQREIEHYIDKKQREALSKYIRYMTTYKGLTKDETISRFWNELKPSVYNK